ncbi:hypothetical protein CBR_g1085 [Chara braunii]|uniref:CCHC-type domain-containing protein n=1 Tax=Chara braunii TaxID=69332 RepID=A0A388KD84_CHABU|nr:hypothetical protein CBR_g1085 [Chara braunii]|eukprot:GBG67966.1 hypothetical protein CBR_g1085 [Chara braunii]
MAGPLLCYNCDMPGHFAREFPYPRRTCFSQQSNNVSSFPSLSGIAPPMAAANDSFPTQAPLLALPALPNPSHSSNSAPSKALVPRHPWWKLNQEKLDRVYEFMASELEARQEAIHERERLLREDEERRKIEEAEEKALRKLKELQDFEDRISMIVGTKINEACDLFLGKADMGKATGAVDNSRIPNDRFRIRPNIDLEKERVEKQVELLRQEHEFIKKQMEELTRSIRQAGVKRTSARVCITRPLDAPARGKARVMGVGTPPSHDFEKLLKAYNFVKEVKRIADLEVQAIKDKFDRVVAKLVR